MGHKTHVRLIDAHTKGNGRNDYNRFFVNKSILNIVSVFLGESSMIRHGLKACRF